MRLDVGIIPWLKYFAGANGTINNVVNTSTRSLYASINTAFVIIRHAEDL